jgi:uncharacterized cupredoxin-like copper-binding protein
MFMQYKTYRTPAVVAAMLTAFGLVGPAFADTTTQTTTTEVTTLGAPATVVQTSNGVRSTTTTTVAPVGITGTTGGTVYFRTAKPEVLVLTLTARRKDLDKMIDAAHAKGNITGKKAEAMKNELKRIARETGSNTITYERAVAYARDLDYIGTSLGTVVVEGVPAYQPIIAGSHFTVVNGQIYVLDDLSVRRVDLEARIIKDYLEGRLTDARATKLRDELDAIGATQAIYSATGELDPVSSRKFYKEMDSVASELEKYAGKDNN